MASGSIIWNGIVLEKHEQATVEFLLRHCTQIELISPNKSAGVRTADIKMAGQEWELKSPKGKGKYLLQNTIHKALRQSPNIVVDLRRINMPEQKALAELEKIWLTSKSIRKLKIITKGRRLLDYCK